ncbi:DUF3299 domain-containing protein [Ideonella sp. DXS29W]|uniref:DUF3299 domain-containing protein n=1 Tax=Ideonella lacteola TaxID=2984193 RepID=A0ABU9BR26_9BURK
MNRIAFSGWVRGSVTLAACLGLVGPSSPWAAGVAPADAGAKPASYREAKWDELMPPGWDPAKDLRINNLGVLSDSDPRVVQMMRELRQALDNAPLNQAMDGAAVRLPGYVVPLDDTPAGMKEFLLVPYFGACIHTPPPPANQIVHVIVPKPAKGLKMMDAVWVSGTLKAQRGDSVMGVSGYQMEAAQIAPYQGPAR